LGKLLKTLFLNCLFRKCSQKRNRVKSS